MSEQVQALHCGHFTNRNPDGSVPWQCDYCLLQGAASVNEDLEQGRSPLPAETVERMLEAIERIKVDGEDVLRRIRGEEPAADEGEDAR